MEKGNVGGLGNESETLRGVEKKGSAEAHPELFLMTVELRLSEKLHPPASPPRWRRLCRVLSPVTSHGESL
jgi:hypothetical protein